MSGPHFALTVACVFGAAAGAVAGVSTACDGTVHACDGTQLLLVPSQTCPHTQIRQQISTVEATKANSAAIPGKKQT